MKIFSHASVAVDGARDAAEKIGQAAQWNTIALILTSAVSVVALVIALFTVTSLARGER